MADVKELTDEQLQNELKRITQTYKAFLTDEKTVAGKKSFLEFLISKRVPDPQKEQKKTALLVHESVRRQLSDYALLLFLYMEKNNDYGQMGEQRVSISFCRNILDIPASREVTQDDADTFREKLDAFEKKLNISSVAKIKEKIAQFSVDYLGEQVPLSAEKKLNAFLENVGVPYRLFTGNMKGVTTFIYGAMEGKTIVGKEIVIIKKEVVRSPHYVLSIAAGNGSVGVFIRRESCETIFYNKWVGYFQLSPYERQMYNVHPYSSIREGIKGAALKHYAVSSAAELEKIKELFIQEMIEGIFYHEVGHEVGEEARMPFEEERISKSRGVVGDDIIVVLKEAIADWAPPLEKQSGPLWHFLQIAQKDPVKATRMVYVYLSDNWFIDAHEEFMADQTDVLCALMLWFIKPDGSVDFQRMENDFNAVFDFIMSTNISILEKIKKFLKDGVYVAGIHRITFDALEKELYKVYTKDKKDLTMDELRTKTTYWVHLMGLVKSFSPETSTKIEDLVKKSSMDVKRSVLEKVSEGGSARYNDSLREYIVQRMVEIGVYKKSTAPDMSVVIRQVAKELKLPDQLAQKVIAQFQKIVDGEPIDIAINYEGKPDPFWAVFQSILLDSGYGNIRSGMAVGESILPQDPPEVRTRKVKEALETIRDQIESEMYLEVKLLRVNGQYVDQAMFDAALADVKFFDNAALKDKITTVQFLELKNAGLMEAYIPLKRGFVDWNTSQAIWRINQELRPDDYLKQWTVDSVFIKNMLDVHATAALS